MHHMKTLSLMLCLLLPAAALADDAPVQTQLVPSEQNAPPPAVEDAKTCGMHKCGRAHRGRGGHRSGRGPCECPTGDPVK
jgi:hypothetical protein